MHALISVRAQMGRRQRNRSNLMNKSLYRKSYHQYDSHGDSDGECLHCDRHHGGHNDCCPRYIDDLLPLTACNSDEAIYLDSNAAPPKQRQIKQLDLRARLVAKNDFEQNTDSSDDDRDMINDSSTMLKSKNEFQCRSTSSQSGKSTYKCIVCYCVLKKN